MSEFKLTAMCWTTAETFERIDLGIFKTHDEAVETRDLLNEMNNCIYGNFEIVKEQD